MNHLRLASSIAALAFALFVVTSAPVQAITSLPYAAAVYSAQDGGLWIVGTVNLQNAYCYKGTVTYNSTTQVYTITKQWSAASGIHLCAVGTVYGYAVGFFAMSSAPTSVRISLAGGTAATYSVGNSTALPMMMRRPRHP